MIKTTSRLVPPNTLQRPPLARTVAEMRAVAEIGAYFLTRNYLKKKAPKGDGHPVLVIPGFMTGDAFTLSLRRLLEKLGYEVHPWDQGTNQGLRDHICQNIETRVAEIFRDSGRKLSLIGHSLGGVYVRAIAHRQPHHVRQIITLGSPFNASFDQGEADSKGGALARAYEQLNPGVENDELPRSDLMCFPPLLPSTSVYSEGDGIVGWQHCLDIADQHTENIRVPGSHTGMPHNPLVIYLVADRLAQIENEWRPFDPGGLKKLLLKPACITQLFPGWVLDDRWPG